MAEYYVNFEDVKHLNNMEKEILFKILDQIRYSQKEGIFQSLSTSRENILSDLELDYIVEEEEEIQEIYEVLDCLKDYGLLIYDGFFSEGESEDDYKLIEININPYLFLRKSRKEVSQRNKHIAKRIEKHNLKTGKNII